MLVRAIRLLSVVTITPVIGFVLMLLGLSVLLELLGISDCWGCTAFIVIRVFWVISVFQDGRVCVTRARTSQRRTALIVAVTGKSTACVEALIAAKAALDIQDVSYARLFACPVTLILCLFAH